MVKIRVCHHADSQGLTRGFVKVASVYSMYLALMLTGPILESDLPRDSSAALLKGFLRPEHMSPPDLA